MVDIVDDKNGYSAKRKIPKPLIYSNPWMSPWFALIVYDTTEFEC